MSGLTSGAVAVVAGGQQTCALSSTGAIECWGYNNLVNSATRNNGTEQPNRRPARVTGLGANTTLMFGKASYSTAALTGGSHTISGNYSGDANHGSSTDSLSQTVNTAATATAVVPAGSTVTGQNASFTVKVTSTVGTPTGTATVDFGDGSSATGHFERGKRHGHPRLCGGRQLHGAGEL